MTSAFNFFSATLGTLHDVTLIDCDIGGGYH